MDSHPREQVAVFFCGSISDTGILYTIVTGRDLSNYPNEKGLNVKSSSVPTCILSIIKGPWGVFLRNQLSEVENNLEVDSAA